MAGWVQTVQRRSLVAAIFALLLLAPLVATPGVRVGAQDELPAGVSLVAGGLDNPRGITWDDDGDLLVALAGNGGDTPAAGAIEVPPPIGPWQGGPTAALVQIQADGCGMPVASGLPSAIDSTGAIVGVADVALLGGDLYILVAGGGEEHGNPETPSGVYRVIDGGVELVADLSAWIRANPVAEVPADYDPEGSLFSMIAGAADLWIVESNSEQILTVTPDGMISRVADLSADNAVPTDLAAAPGGGVYVATLSGFPYRDGTASVLKVAEDGSVETVWTNLTAVTGIAVAADGTLYATEMATDNLNRPPFVRPRTGTIVRQTGAATAEAVATGLDFPVALDFGPDGALYVSYPATGGEHGGGAILRIDLATAELPVDLGHLTLEAPVCGDAGRATAATEEATEVADEEPTEAPTATAEPTAAPTEAPTEVTVDIIDFAFDPAEITITVGTTVTWVNIGPTDHTTTAFINGDRLWDSRIMVAGDTFSYTFTEPGVFDYLCNLHPSMKAVVTVVEE